MRLGSESSLLYTDITVELSDGSLADVEIQKIGYAFPGERCACYSADHLLRQYKTLDIYRKSMENKAIGTALEAWLAFLSFTDPKRIEELIAKYPKFQAMYQDIYDLCQNTERVMHMYSKELQQLDHNTVMYMIDELQAQVEQKDRELGQKDREISALKEQLAMLQQNNMANNQNTEIKP